MCAWQCSLDRAHHHLKIALQPLSPSLPCSPSFTVAERWFESVICRTQRQHFTALQLKLHRLNHSFGNERSRQLLAVLITLTCLQHLAPLSLWNLCSHSALQLNVTLLDSWSCTLELSTSTGLEELETHVFRGYSLHNAPLTVAHARSYRHAPRPCRTPLFT